jgi:esterase
MNRRELRHEGRRLSYLDAEGPGDLVVALHGHWMEAITFEPLARALSPAWRIVALDQRGHGHSDRAPTYRREDYLGDLDALLAHLAPESPVVLLGHSLGGVNAYQYAARHPERVRALVVEDIGAVNAADAHFVLDWAGNFETREALERRIGSRLSPYLRESFRETASGWRLAFEPEDMVRSQELLNGDRWADWLATVCPALLLRGRQSRLTTQDHLEEMAARRPGTRLVVLDGGHVVHADDPDGFAREVRAFLDEQRTP